MTTDNNVNQLIINQLTKIQYKELVDNNTLSENELYVITDEVHYTDDELKTLLQTKQDVLTASGKISIDNNIITVDLSDYNTIEEINTKLKDYVKLEDNLYIIKNKTDFIKLDTSNIGKIESIRYINDQTYSSNLIIINNKLYCITRNDDNYTLTEITTTGSTQANKWIKISADDDSTLGSLNNGRNFGIDSTGKLFSIYHQSYTYLSNISDNWTDISGYAFNKYRHAYGINNGELYGITYESNQFVFTKISDYNDWTNVCGFSDSEAKAYGIRNGLLYRLKPDNTIEQVDTESGWVKICGIETADKKAVGLKNGVLQVVTSTGVTPVNTDINSQSFTTDMSNAEFNSGFTNPYSYAVVPILNNNKLYYIYKNGTISTVPLNWKVFEISGYSIDTITFIGNYDNGNSHNLYRQGQIGSDTNWKYVYSFDDTYLIAYLSNPFYNENDINDKLQEIVNDLDSKISTKQDIITDLDDIRDGANKGSTALQTEVDPIYTADKPNIALKSEVNDLDSKINILDTKVDAKQDILTAGKGIEISNNIVSSNIQGVPIGTVYPCLCTADYIPEGALPCDGSEYTKGQFTDLWNNYFGEPTYNLSWNKLNNNWRIDTQTNDLIFDGNYFITVGNNDTTKYRQASDTSWHNIDVGVDLATWTGIAFNGNNYVLVNSSTGSSTQRYNIVCSYTNNFANWHKLSIENDDNIIIKWLGITYGNGKFIAISNGNNIGISIDGITWTIQTIENHNFNKIKFINNIFVILCTNGEILYSNDGTNWTTKLISSEITTNGFNDIIYDGDKYIAINSQGKVSISNDLENWTTSNILSNSNDTLTSIVYNLKHYVLSCTSLDSSGYISSTKLIVSKDLQNFETIEIENTNNTILKIISYISNSTSKILALGDYIAYDSNLNINFTNNKLSVCTYSQYQYAISTYGSCAKFGIDIENNTFKLPTIKPNKTLIYSGAGTYTTYRIYSDGFCEQWGKITVSANGANTATFDWSFKDTDYYLECAGYNTAGTDTANYTVQNSAYWNKTTTGFTCFGLVNKPKPFYACGYINTNASLFQTYFNNTEINRYFVQVTNGTINQSQMNWSQYASALQGKSNTDLNNLSDTGKKVIDGQWVNKTQILSSDTNIGVYTLDLSEYLPSDNYIYEVELFGHVRCDNSNPVTFIINDTYSIATKNSIGSLQQIYLTIPVLPTDRTIKKEIQKVKCTSTVLTAIRYRRIGTNE